MNIMNKIWRSFSGIDGTCYVSRGWRGLETKCQVDSANILVNGMTGQSSSCNLLELYNCVGYGSCKPNVFHLQWRDSFILKNLIIMHGTPRKVEKVKEQ